MTLITAGGTSLNQECKRYLTAHQDGRTVECTIRERHSVGSSLQPAFIVDMALN